LPRSLYTEFVEQGDELADLDQHPKYRDVFDLLDKLLTVDYRQRPMAKEALQHPFFGDEN